MSMFKTFKQSIKGFSTTRTFLLSQSGVRAKLHSTKEIWLGYDNGNTICTNSILVGDMPSGVSPEIASKSNVYLLSQDYLLDEPAILMVRKDMKDDEIIGITYPDGSYNEVHAWKLKVAPTEVIGIAYTCTAESIYQLYLTI